MSVDSYLFMSQVEAYGRMNQFGYDGWLELFDYLEDQEDQTGQEMELDIIALCCDYARYSSLEEYNEQNGTDYTHPCDIEVFVTWIDGCDAFIALYQ